MTMLHTENIRMMEKEFKLRDEVIANYVLLSFELNQNFLYFIMDELCYELDLSSNISDFIIQDFYLNANLNEKSIFFNKRIMIVDEFVIKEPFRGKDIGSKILLTIKEEAQEEGYDYIVLKPFPIGNVDFAKFYEIYQKILEFYLRNNYISLDLAGIDYQYLYQKIN